MVKKILVIAALSLAVIGSQAQNALFKKGQKDFNFGINFGGTVAKAYAYDMKSSFPHLQATFHYGISDAFSVGAYLGYESYNVYTEVVQLVPLTTYYGKEGTATSFNGGLRLLYHFDVMKDVDTYVGGVVGFNAVKETLIPNVISDFDNRVKKSTTGLFVGARYMFSKNTGAFVEVGYKTTSLALGIHTKL